MRLLWWVLAAIAVVVIVVAVVGALLPQDHVVSRTILLAASPDRVRDLILDVQRYPSWRSGITRVVTQPPPLSEGPRIRWREFSREESLGFSMDASQPRRLVTRITDEALSFGGSWIFDLAPADEGTSLTITEHGEVHNPIVRFVSRFLMGHTKSIDQYAADLALKLNAPVSVTAPVPGT